jgi:DtxR family Mn-dependent transcriptional regulator
MEMIAARGDGYVLTDRGRREALRVVRLHRLWERYLSEETGLGAEEWHREAERREHRTTPEQAADLAARMGFPRFDPHGDPIPTEKGEVIPPEGVPLHALRPGSSAEIVHVEDEPSAVYSQLVAAGLYPGMRVDIIESDPRRVRLHADDGRRHDITPVLAANLTVREIAEPVTDEPGTEALSALSPGERASVTAISPACHGPERRRLLDLGIVPDTVVEAELVSPSGDPTAYRIRGALIALRREQASLIRVRRIDGEATA